MTVLNVGSINWDRVFRVPHFPAPGETLHAASSSVGLGGKGLNQTVAIARAGGAVRHVGAVGAADRRVRGELARLGVDPLHIVGIEGAETGSATVLVDEAGENLIVLDRGANGRIPDETVADALARAAPGDWLLFQNETNQAAACARLAKEKGLRVAFSAAPFVADTVAPLLDALDLLAVNAVELEQLAQSIGGAERLPGTLSLLVTRGAEGAEFAGPDGAIRIPAHPGAVRDTTGAGDVFLGVFLAAIDAKETPRRAMDLASAAAALQIGRDGAVEAIPTRAEILAEIAGA